MSGPIEPTIHRVRWAALLLLVSLGSGCVTIAEHRKLEDEVHKLSRQSAVGSDPRATVADLAAEIEGLRTEVASLQGRLDVAEHRSSKALEEARAARQAAHGTAPAATRSPEEVVPGSASAGEDLRAYHEAYSAWRSDETQVCIDRFREFLQTHPSSEYADDAAFWMADCHFKQGDYRTAVLRFDDVAGRYPAGNKAADALYRQGEALVRLGYSEAAVKAFERVLNEYPESPRAVEAKRQVELLRSSG